MPTAGLTARRTHLEKESYGGNSLTTFPALGGKWFALTCKAVTVLSFYRSMKELLPFLASVTVSIFVSNRQGIEVPNFVELLIEIDCHTVCLLASLLS